MLKKGFISLLVFLVCAPAFAIKEVDGRVINPRPEGYYDCVVLFNTPSPRKNYLKWSETLEKNIQVRAGAALGKSDVLPFIREWYQNQITAFRTSYRDLHVELNQEDKFDSGLKYGWFFDNFFNTHNFLIEEKAQNDFSDIDAIMLNLNRVGGDRFSIQGQGHFILHPFKMAVFVVRDLEIPMKDKDQIRFSNRDRGLPLAKIFEFNEGLSEITESLASNSTSNSYLTKQLRKILPTKKPAISVSETDYIVVAKVIQDPQSNRPTLFAITRKGHFYLKDYQTGQLLKTYKVENLKVTGATPQAPRSDGAWVVTGDHYLLEFDLKTFSVQKTSALKSAVLFPTLVQDPSGANKIIAVDGFLSFVVIDPIDFEIESRFKMDHLPNPTALANANDSLDIRAPFFMPKIANDKSFDVPPENLPAINLDDISESFRKLFSDPVHPAEFPMEMSLLLQRLTVGDARIAFTPIFIRSFSTAFASVLKSQDSEFQWAQDRNGATELITQEYAEEDLTGWWVTHNQLLSKTNKLVPADQYLSFLAWRVWQNLLLNYGLVDDRPIFTRGGKRYYFLDSRYFLTVTYTGPHDPAVKNILAEIRQDPEKLKFVLTMIREMIPQSMSVSEKYVTEGLKKYLKKHKTEEVPTSFKFYLYPGLFEKPVNESDYAEWVRVPIVSSNAEAEAFYKRSDALLIDIEKNINKPRPVLSFPNVVSRAPVLQPVIMLANDADLMTKNLEISSKYTVIRESLTEASPEIPKLLEMLSSNMAKAGSRLRPMDYQNLVNKLINRKQELADVIREYKILADEVRNQRLAIDTKRSGGSRDDSEIMAYKIAITVIQQNIDSDLHFLTLQSQLLDSVLTKLPVIVIQTVPYREKTFTDLFRDLTTSLNQKLF